MKNLRALLIGISHYEKNEVCDSLEGAVDDVEAMEAYLLAQGLTADRICNTSTTPGHGLPGKRGDGGTEPWLALDRVARRVPRLRQRVVADPLGLAPPRWSPDPDFQLSFHLRHARLGVEGGQRFRVLHAIAKAGRVREQVSHADASFGRQRASRSPAAT